MLAPGMNPQAATTGFLYTSLDKCWLISFPIASYQPYSYPS